MQSFRVPYLELYVTRADNGYIRLDTWSALDTRTLDPPIIDPRVRHPPRICLAHYTARAWANGYWDASAISMAFNVTSNTCLTRKTLQIYIR